MFDTDQKNILWGRLGALLDRVQRARKDHPQLQHYFHPTLYGVAEFMGAVRAVLDVECPEQVLSALDRAITELADRTTRSIERVAVNLDSGPPKPPSAN